MKIPVTELGVIRNPAFAIPASAEAAPVPVVSEYEWYPHAIPTYSQKFPSCVGHATANWLEMMLRRELGDSILGKGEQIDGDAIWKRGREMFHGGSLDGGLLMPQGFLAAIDLGILPPGATVVTLAPSVAAVAKRLSTSPVLQGTAVHEGWNEPDPSNGQIPLLLPNPFAGHATCIVSVTKQGDNSFLPFQNSWGAGWGRFGYGMLRDDQWLQCLIDDPVSCDLGRPLAAWDAWRKYVTRIP